MKLIDARKALWHFNQGGSEQLFNFLYLREKSKRLLDSEPYGKSKGEKDLSRNIDQTKSVSSPSEFDLKLNEVKDTRIAMLAPKSEIELWSLECEVVDLLNTVEFSSVRNSDFVWIDSQSLSQLDDMDYTRKENFRLIKSLLSGIFEVATDFKIPVVYIDRGVKNTRMSDRFLNKFDLIVTSQERVGHWRRQRSRAELFVSDFSYSNELSNPARSHKGSVSRPNDICLVLTGGGRVGLPQKTLVSTALEQVIGAVNTFGSTSRIISTEKVELDPSLNLDSSIVIQTTSPIETELTQIGQKFKICVFGNLADENANVPSSAYAALSAGCEVFTFGYGDEFDSFEPNYDLSALQHLLEYHVRSPLIREREVRLLQRGLQGHTHSELLEHIVKRLAGKHPKKGERGISVILPCKRKEKLDQAITQVLAQKNVNVEVIVGLHGFSAKDFESNYDPSRVKFHEFEVKESLGFILNELVKLSSHTIVAKMDDDDLYGPNYLSDQLHSLETSRADLVGKQASFVYFNESEELCIHKPWREQVWTDHVLGATLLGQRRLFIEFPFMEVDKGEDTSFISNLNASGKKIFATDRFNYVQVRSGVDQHSWKIRDLELKRNSSAVGFGLNLSTTFV